MGKHRASDKQLKNKLRKLELQEEDLKREVNRLRESLLIADQQIFYRIYRFFHLFALDLKSSFIKPAPPKPLSKKTIDEEMGEIKTKIRGLTRNKKQLIALSRSPYTLIVWASRALGMAVFFIPTLIQRNMIRQELKQAIPAAKQTDIIWFGSRQFLSGRFRARFLCEAMAKKGKRVFYVESRFSPVAKGKPRFEVAKAADNLYLVTLSAARDIDILHQPATGRETQSIATSLRHFMKDASVGRSMAVFDHPFWGHLQTQITMPIVYDCNTNYDHAELEPHIPKLHRLLVKKSSLVISSSRLLLKELKKLKPLKTKLVSNGCDYEHFAKASVKKDTCSAGLCWIRKPVIGYIGSCDSRIDAALVEKVALAYPKASIVMIGKIDNPTLLNVGERLPNVFLLGEKPYEKLPEYLSTIDVCFFPLNKNSTNYLPIVICEALASGRPIISTNSFDRMQYKNIIQTAYSDKNYLKLLKKTINKLTVISSKQRRNYASSLKWDNISLALIGHSSLI